MTALAAIQLAMQLMGMFPTVEPALVKGVQDLKDLIAGGGTVPQSDIDALLDRVKAQSAAIQAL